MKTYRNVSIKQMLILSILLFVLTTQISFGEIPRTIGYQGILTQTDGAIVPDGDYTLTFSIYDVETGGVDLWSEDQVVMVNQGVFNVILGSITPLSPDLTAFDKPYWLGIQVNGGTELSPRIAMTASPYSLNTMPTNGGDSPWTVSGDDIYYIKGNVGIGTANPAGIGTARALHLVGIDSLGLFIEKTNATTGKWGFALGSDGSLLLRDDANAANVFKIQKGAPDSAMVIEATTGNVGIGTTGPLSTLDVNGSVRMNNFTSKNNFPSDLAPEELPIAWYTAQVSNADGYPFPHGHILGNTNHSNDYSYTFQLFQGHTGDLYYRRAESATSWHPWRKILINSGSGGESVIYDDGSNVGIGTTSPLGKLQVDGGSSVVTSVIKTTNTGAHSAILRLQNSNGAFNDVMEIGQGAGRTTFKDGNGKVQMAIDISNSRIGIGTAEPGAKLDVRGSGMRIRNDAQGEYTALRVQGSGYEHGLEIDFFGKFQGDTYGTGIGGAAIVNVNNAPLALGTNNKGQLYITGNGNVGIGTTGPGAKLEIYDTSGSRHRGGDFGSSILDIAAVGPGAGWYSKIQARDDHPNFGQYRPLVLNPDGGNVGIGTTDPQAKLDVDGTTRTRVLEITGGADLSEQFEVKGATDSGNDISQTEVKPGMVVCIDTKNPGELVVSRKAYDRTVAGIISGAGGVKPGMLMSQTGTIADGNHPVALTGRVYCYADASNGAIQPGDLLTTSDTPGHAMKVTDYPKAQGAILGKAMSSLEKGHGLILVLVTLQ